MLHTRVREVPVIFMLLAVRMIAEVGEMMSDTSLILWQ